MSAQCAVGTGGEIDPMHKLSMISGIDLPGFGNLSD